VQPFRAESTERLETIIRSRVLPPIPPETCPEPLRRILIKAMAPEPELRYQSAHAFKRDLIAFRKGEPTQAMTEDLDATRRTTPRARPEDDDTRRTTPVADETRRTVVNPAVQEPPIVWGKKARKPRLTWGELPLRSRQAVAAFVVLFAMWLVYAGVTSFALYRRGAQFEREIAEEKIVNPDEIWNRWTELSDGNSSSLLLRGARKAVDQRLTEAADRVIDNYRNTNSTNENNWKGARDELTRVMQLDPNDSVRGKLRLTEAHIARINGTAHPNTQLLNEAVDKFTEAEHLLPKSPDPELGLGRLYIYGLKDVDKANHAFQEAERRGHPMGNPEKAQLADGYQDRADRLVKDSRNLKGMPQEKEQLKRAKSDYEESLRLYQAVAPYANANKNIMTVEANLQAVENRLQSIDDESNGVPSTKEEDPSKRKGLPPWLQTILRGIWQSREAKQ
jgi:tetratricopeptide (TPR) repeat protein